MIPLLLIVRVGWFRLWLPLIVVWISLLPLVLILLPIAMLSCFIIGLKPLETLLIHWRVLTALPGTSVELSHGKYAFAVRIL
jgi:hypothetical protein